MPGYTDEDASTILTQACGPRRRTTATRSPSAPWGWPQLDLWVNGVNVTSWTVSDSWQTYIATVTLTGQDYVDLGFANDRFDATSDSNLRVDSLQIDNQTPLAPTVAVYDRGAGAAAFDGQDVLPGQSLMP